MVEINEQTSIAKQKISKKTNETPMGIPSGLDGLDTQLEGFRNGQVTMIGGRPNMGTTTLVINIIKNIIALQKHRLALFSFDKSKTYFENKLDDIKDSNRLYIDDNQHMSIYDIMEKAIQLKQTQHIDLLVIDKLQLIKQKKSNSFEAIARLLQILAKSLNISVLLTSSLPKKLERRRLKHPILTDLNEFGNIEKYADVVLFLYRDAYYGISDDYEGNDISDVAMLIAAKDRNGEGRYVYLRYDPLTSSYFDNYK